MQTLPDAGRRPAVLSVLALAIAAWMTVPEYLLRVIPDKESWFGSMYDVMFVVEYAATPGTLLLAVGSAAVQARRVLIGAAAVVSLHLLFQIVVMAELSVVAVRSQVFIDALGGAVALVMALVGVLLALLLRRPMTARLVGVAAVLVGVIVHSLWATVLYPLIEPVFYDFADASRPGMVWSLQLTAMLGLPVVAAVAAALCGWAAPVARWVGALLAAVVGVLDLRDVDGSYVEMQNAQALLTLAAVLLAVVAGRRLAAPRQTG